MILIHHFRLFLLLISTVIDKYFYGKWVIVHWEFLKFNFLTDMGAFYGTHPWHWYLTQGFLTIMTTHMLPFIMGAWTAKDKTIVYIIVWTIFIYR
jgi:phosphatidylinositol glycan class B